MYNISKYLIVLLTAIIPAVFMSFSTYFINLNERYSNILKSFTGGLLLMAGFSVFKEEVEKKHTFGIISFIISILFLYFKELKNSSILESFYFDSLSDGLLLGTLLITLKDNKLLLPLLVALTIEMSITSISVSNELRKQGDKDNKEKTIFGALILSLSVVLGYLIGNKLNKNVINGIGGAAMLWLSIGSFINNVKQKNLIFIFVGIVAGIFID